MSKNITLESILSNLPEETIVSDGGTDWSPVNLMDELNEEYLSRPVYFDGRDIYFYRDDGYRESIPAFTVRSVFYMSVGHGACRRHSDRDVALTYHGDNTDVYRIDLINEKAFKFVGYDRQQPWEPLSHDAFLVLEKLFD